MDRVAVFEVVEPGILTMVQDLGRYGYSQFGVPPSGASDPFSLRVANLLVGNEEGEACLETAIMGLRLRAIRETIIAITGGDLSPTLNGEPLEMWRTHLVIEGDVVGFPKVRAGCRAYFAIRGGIALPTIMGSKSTYLSGKFGGLEGRAVKRGDVLSAPDAVPSFNKTGIRFPREWIPIYEKEALLRFIPGPQDQHFTDAGFTTFRSSTYRVTSQSDRMGIRLEGPKIERRSDVEESIISESLVPGAIQVPGDGKPIIILTELVTGGYTKIATIISADIPRTAQLKPGDRVRFEPIRIEEAHRALKEQEEGLQHFKDSRRSHKPCRK